MSEATKQDLLDLEARTKNDMRETEERLIKALRDVEAAILTEFHNWTSPGGMRVRSHRAVLRALDD